MRLERRLGTRHRDADQGPEIEVVADAPGLVVDARAPGAVGVDDASPRIVQCPSHPLERSGADVQTERVVSQKQQVLARVGRILNRLSERG